MVPSQKTVVVVQSGCELRRASMPYATSTDGVRISYKTIGSGPPLLLIHGGTGTSESWELFGYLDALTPDYQLILMDLRGHGKSDKPHGRASYRMSQQADDVVAVLDDAGIARTHVWGLSLGVRVGFHLGARNPDRVLSLILWGGHPYPVTPEDVEFDTSLIATLRDGMDAWAELVEATGRHREILLEADAEALIGAVYAEIDDPGVADSLAQMVMPCLLIVGELDDANDLARQAARELPRADFVSVGGLGHDARKSNVWLPYVNAFLQHVQTGAFDIK
jgi:pimeloyl-ACP methyl ester carboxylesterase